MSRHLTLSVVVLTVLGGNFAATKDAAAGTLRQAQAYSYVCEEQSSESTPVVASKATFVAVQQTPQYDLRRPEVPSGARLTLFANFLGDKPGCVTFNLNGTSIQCQVVEWRGESVTIELPRLGLTQPKNADLKVILPDGRIAKTFRVLLVAQPDVVVHKETVPLPLPPSPATQSPSYSVSTPGGMILYAGE
jgi:hypothetical protein